MPCFKGIAVSVHADGAPLPEYSVQKQSRVSRVNTYIPVPPPKIPKGSPTNKPEPSKFAISITLLTPGLAVPYSTPKPSISDPYPKPQIVADLPGPGAERPAAVIGPYIPLTKSENETIAAYIYFDGRAKEEVATLLRPGEETWVNSRWVQVPESEGGGLAEREFLFREVGLERWLNGLDLDGQDAAAKIKRRREKFEKRRRRREAAMEGGMSNTRSGPRDILRYGADERSPVEQLSEDEELSSDSDDDAPPEATGQIKVAMFRVLASGEIKRGEYSPQFDAHDDDDESSDSGMKDGGNGSVEDVDHTTSFAKPKTLDPSTISTQTVTGIDGPDKPYATFTFFYRGERQLQKMGIVESSKSQKQNGATTKRGSTQMDFSSLGPLKATGTVGFSTFRDNDPTARRKSKSRKKSNGSIGGVMEEDSDDEENDDLIMGKMDDVDDKDVKATLSPDDARRQGELADGLDRIKLKRQHSAEPESAASRRSPASNVSPTDTPPEIESVGSTSATTAPTSIFSKNVPDDTIVGSPLKKHRASIHDTDEETKQKRMGAAFPPGLGDVLASAEASQSPKPDIPTVHVEVKEEEEL